MSPYTTRQIPHSGSPRSPGWINLSWGGPAKIYPGFWSIHQHIRISISVMHIHIWVYMRKWIQFSIQEQHSMSLHIHCSTYTYKYMCHTYIRMRIYEEMDVHVCVYSCPYKNSIVWVCAYTAHHIRVSICVMHIYVWVYMRNWTYTFAYIIVLTRIA